MRPAALLFTSGPSNTSPGPCRQSSEDIDLEVSEQTTLLAMGKSNESSFGESEITTESKTPPTVGVTEAVFTRTRGRTFETDSLESHYKPIDTYEGRHRYDPSFEWEPQEERKVVRKVSELFSRHSHPD